MAGAVRLSPLNVRPVLGVRPSLNAKGCALLAMAARRRAAATGNRAHADLAVRMTTELQRMAVPAGDAFGWGYDFPWANRSFLAPAGSPNAVVTCFALDALAGDPGQRLSAAGVRFLRSGLNWWDVPGGRAVSYTALDRREVVNVLALVARALWRSGGDGDRSAAEELAGRVLALQAPDGSWPYGSAANDAFIDLYHTGFVLRSLRDLDSWGMPGLRAAQGRGLAFLERELITGDGTPRPGPGRRYPVDTHAWAELVLVGAAFERPWLGTAVAWGLDHLRRRDGAFVYQLRRPLDLRTPYIRWSQAWAYLAIATVLERGR
jgi:hypothetical protein